MKSLDGIRQEMINNISKAGLAQDKLFEYENSRWVCLGWKSYGGGQLIEYVREYGDYQVAMHPGLTDFCEDEELNKKAEAYWGRPFGYQRVIVTHLEATGMIIEKVDDDLSYQHPYDPISLKTLREWQEKQHLDIDGIPNHLIPFWIFERANDIHLSHEARHDVDLKKLIEAAEIGRWHEKDNSEIKITLN